jgi:hypothetical protein
MRQARSWGARHGRAAVLGPAILAMACGGGGSGTLDDGGVTTTQSGRDGGTVSDARAQDATASDGATALDRCAQAGGTCLSSSGGKCAAGTYRDDGRSCPPANGAGANMPCCIPIKDGSACEGLPPVPWSSPPTHCGGQTCAAGATHCETVASGEPGGMTTVACGSATECAKCLSCACINRLDTYSGACGGCTESGGTISLSCAAP